MFKCSKPKENKFYKCLIVGDSGTGKTTFIKRHLMGVFQKQHIATVGVRVHSIVLETDRGSVEFEVWDTAGQEKLGGLRNGYYFNADCAIVMFDLSSLVTCRNVCKWRQEIHKICGEHIPIVVCGNKADLELSEVHTGSLRFRSKQNFEYFIISIRANYNIDLPFQWLCQKILKCDNLCLVAQPRMNAPDVEISQCKRKQIQTELDALKKLPYKEDECKCSFSDHAECSRLNFL